MLFDNLPFRKKQVQENKYKNLLETIFRCPASRSVCYRRVSVIQGLRYREVSVIEDVRYSGVSVREVLVIEGCSLQRGVR